MRARAKTPLSRSRAKTATETPGADVERDVTVLVKTFERPDALGRLVASIRRFYPRIPILVVDDSREPLEPVPDGITRYLHEPYNSLGSGPGRNFALRHAETEYVLFSDDDMVFGRKTDLRRMLRTLETTAFDVVSCRWMDHDPWRSIRIGFNRWEGTLDLEGDTLVHTFGNARGEQDGLEVFDVVHQFFVAPVERLGHEPWHPELTVIDHDECFLRLRERALLCTRLRDVVVYHYPQRPAAYASVRDQTGSSMKRWKEVRGFRRRVFRGRQYHPAERLVYGLPSTAAYVARRSSRAARRILRGEGLRAHATMLIAVAAICFVPGAHGATITIGKGLGPWKLGQKYVKRPGIVRSERHPERDGPGCDLGPRSASRIDYYRTLRLSWRGLGPSRSLYLIDVATTRKGDGTREGFVIGRSRLRGIRRAHPNARLTHPSDRYRLGRSALTVVRKSGPESWVTLAYWFDRRDRLAALETSQNGC